MSQEVIKDKLENISKQVKKENIICQKLWDAVKESVNWGSL